MILFSIIIPAYNSYSYIRACIDSVYSQGLNDDSFEVIVVDDGSTDNTSEIISSFNEHFNLRYYYQANSGVSVARNSAINNANGQYILFLDSDDFFYPNSLRNIASYLQESVTDADIIICRSLQENGKEDYRWDNNFIENEIYTSEDFIRRKYIRGSACGCLFRRNIILDKKIFFPEGIRNSEDTIFMFLCMSHGMTFSFLNIVLYVIRVREGSASRSFTEERIVRSIDSLHFVNNCLFDATDNKWVLEYLKYVLLSNIILTIILTPNVGYSFMNTLKVKDFLPINDEHMLLHNWKISLLNKSLPLYYFIVYIKTKL